VRKTFLEQFKAFPGSSYCAFQEENLIYQKFKLFIEQNENCFSENNFNGHVTASAFILSHDLSKLLLIYHKKLKIWIQPGGHVEEGEEVFNAALREVQEETGLKDFSSYLPLEKPIFDLDVHHIPSKNPHFHYDVRYLFKLESPSNFLKSPENIEMKWVSLSEIEKYTRERSVLRPAEKIKSFCS